MKVFGWVIVRKEEIDSRVAEAQLTALTSLVDARKSLAEATLDGEASARQIIHLCEEIEWMRHHQLFPKPAAKKSRKAKTS